MAITNTANKELNVIDIGDTGWGVPTNDNVTILDKALGSSDTVSGTSGSITLTDTQYQNMCLKSDTAAFTANVTFVIPSTVAGQWVVINQSGASNFELRVKNAANATFVSIPRGVTRTVYSDGTTVTFVDTQSTEDLSNLAVGAARATTNASCVGTTATVTFNGGFTVEVDQPITISGVTPTGYNGIWTVTASSAGSVSFTVPAALANESVNGTLYYGAITGSTLNLASRGILSGRATQTEAVDGTDNQAIMTPLRTAQAVGAPNSSPVKSALNATGSAPIYACRAWVNLDGTGAVNILASGNVTSITDLGVGNYRVNFTTAMQDANYATVATTQQSSGNNAITAATGNASGTTLRIDVRSYDANGTLADTPSLSVAIFR
jgi:hypothetical protein